MHRCEIDHLTITAPSLALGARYVERTLGVALQPGGEHPRMGTHNLLLRLGDALFLEVIAVNPAAAGPRRLAHWGVRTASIRSAPSDYLTVAGPIETMTRDSLQWLITIPSDGSLPMHGAVPAIIQWQTAAHPAARLEDKGCTLREIEVHTPDAERVGVLLDALGLAGNVKRVPLRAGEAPRLVAHFDTPAGPRSMGA